MKIAAFRASSLACIKKTESYAIDERKKDLCLLFQLVLAEFAGIVGMPFHKLSCWEPHAIVSCSAMPLQLGAPLHQYHSMINNGHGLVFSICKYMCNMIGKRTSLLLL